MGLTKVSTKISNFLNPAQFYEDIFLVDTDAIDSMVPFHELEKIGVKKEGSMLYELADGAIKEYEYGLARIEFMGEITAGRVIFGEPKSEPLLGVTALESVGIMVDPAKKTLKRIHAIPSKCFSLKEEETNVKIS